MGAIRDMNGVNEPTGHVFRVKGARVCGRRQSGEAPARSGRISKRGSASARGALDEAAWSVMKQPGPLRAFYERVRARRGYGRAIVATAPKLTVLFWCMLRRHQDYAHQRPASTKKKLRERELTAGAKPRTQGRRWRLVDKPGDSGR
jgi:transposase